MEEAHEEFGVIIGRFQVTELHEAHREIIREVQSKHERVIVFLGVSRAICTVRNPLDVWTRKQMIQSEFPDVIVSYIPDFKEDERWVEELDKRIRELAPRGRVVLYGGRDSFIKHYEGTGQFPCKQLETGPSMSGTENRVIASRDPINSSDFRAGIIYGSQMGYPAIIPCVDIAILSEDKTEILLGRKPDERQWRLPGGHIEPKHATAEAACRGEAQEETGAAITDPEYIGSFLVDDWRYRKEVDKIMTFLYIAKVMFGPIRAGSDLEEVRWFKLDQIKEKNIVENHVVLLDAVRRKIDG